MTKITHDSHGKSSVVNRSTILLNSAKGFVYSIVLFLYILMAGLVGTIVLKIIYPNNTGLFSENGKFNSFGYIAPGAETTELLGNWFIPAVLVLIIVIYFIATFSLKRIRKK